MRAMIALVIPGMVFFGIGRRWAGLVCVALQATILGWLPATLWASYVQRRHEAHARIQGMLLHRW